MSEPRERSAPAKRRARARVGESEGRSPSDETSRQRLAVSLTVVDEGRSTIATFTDGETDLWVSTGSKADWSSPRQRKVNHADSRDRTNSRLEHRPSAALRSTAGSRAVSGRVGERRVARGSRDPPAGAAGNGRVLVRCGDCVSDRGPQWPHAGGGSGMAGSWPRRIGEPRPGAVRGDHHSIQTDGSPGRRNADGTASILGPRRRRGIGPLWDRRVYVWPRAREIADAH